MGLDDIHVINDEDYGRVARLQRESRMILSKEMERLDSKKTNMDTEVNNKKRMILLNATYRDKQRQYLILMFLLIFVFLLCLVIVFFQERLGYTSFVMDFMLVFVIGIGGISAYFVYLNILGRDPIDFSKINDEGLLQPVNIIDATKPKTDVASGDLIPISKECVGAECCGPGYTYNSANGVCNKI
jgi:hypothetical protein